MPQLKPLVLVMPGGALIQLITVGAIFNNIPYALTIVLYLVVRKKLGRKEGAFSLGRFEVPVAVVALVPVFAVGLGIAFWGDRPGVQLWIGGAMVLGGVFTMALRALQRSRSLIVPEEI